MDHLRAFRTSDHKAVAIAREILLVASVVGGIALALFLICGTWPAIVTIESESMVPHMNVGDLVIVVEKDRFGPLQSWTSGKETGYQKFGDYGDILIYRPNDAYNPPISIPLITSSIHPIIHRGMARVDAGDQVPQYYNLYRGKATPEEYLPARIEAGQLILENGTVITKTNADPAHGYIVLTNQTTPHAGYITKGDNNQVSDQAGTLSSTRNLGMIQPVKDEWVVGKALFTIPLVGYLPLYIIPVIIILILAMIFYEWYSDRKEEEAKGRKKKPARRTNRK